jgi:hypothetical protein
MVFQVHCDNLTPRPGLRPPARVFFTAGALPELFIGHDRIVPLCFELRHDAGHFDPASSENRDMPMHQRSMPSE